MRARKSAYSHFVEPFFGELMRHFDKLFAVALLIATLTPALAEDPSTAKSRSDRAMKDCMSQQRAMHIGMSREERAAACLQQVKHRNGKSDKIDLGNMRKAGRDSSNSTLP